jgi:biopolymer transport protein ExbD
MKIKRLRKAKKGRIEIIPMIDVMFFLLATFMLASLSMQNFQAVAVNLVQGEAERIKLQKEVVLTIAHDGSIFINKQQIMIDEVSKQVEALLFDAKATVVIASDKDALQGLVMQVMLQARLGGANHFSMIIKN